MSYTNDGRCWTCGREPADRCALCDAWCCAEHAKPHEHLEPQSGPERDRWLSSGVSWSEYESREESDGAMKEPEIEVTVRDCQVDVRWPKSVLTMRLYEGIAVHFDDDVRVLLSQEQAKSLLDYLRMECV